MENLYAKLMAAHSRFLRELCKSHALNTMELYCEYGYCKGILDASAEMPDINDDAARHWEMGHTVETMRQALEALEKFERIPNTHRALAVRADLNANRKNKTKG